MHRSVLHMDYIALLDVRCGHCCHALTAVRRLMHFSAREEIAVVSVSAAAARRRRPHQRHVSITCASSPVIAASFTRSIARDHLAAEPPPR